MSERAGSFFGDFSCFKFWLHSKSDRLLDKEILSSQPAEQIFPALS